MSIDPQFCKDMAAAEIATSAPTKRDKMRSAAWSGLGVRLTPIEVAQTPPPVKSNAPTGYRTLHVADFKTGKGWYPDKGRPNNAEGTDRAENVSYGQGPNGTSALLKFNRDSAGNPYTADIMGRDLQHPMFCAGMAVYSHTPVRRGFWPAFPWFRPVDGGRGEVDLMETFGGHGTFAAPGTDPAKWPITALTLHDTGKDPYHLGRSPQVRLPDTISGDLHTETWVMDENGVTVVLDGVTKTLTRAVFDARYGVGTYMQVFGDPKRMWYPRATLQAGGPDAGSLATNDTNWEFYLHALEIYVPEGS